MKGNEWPLVPLNEVLALHLDKVETTPASEFNIAGVYSFGRGLFQREPLSGTNTTYKYFNRLHKDDYVISQPKAWEGAIARVPAELDGWFLSPVFPTFRANPDRLDIRYLEWFGKQSVVWERLRNVSQGMGARRDSVHPDKFLSLEIPLPPLEEQQRIVDRIDRLADMINEADQLAGQREVTSQSLLMSCFKRFADSAPRQPLGEVAPLDRRPAVVDINAAYPQVSVRSFGRGTFHNPPLLGSEITWQKPHLVKAGDILVSNIKAWEGALAVAGEDDDGRYGSHRYLTFVPVDGVATANFLCFYLLSPEGLYHVGEASPGSADRNRTLSSKKMLEISVPVPPYAEQLKFDSLLQQVRTTSEVHQKVTAARSAMLPSILDRAFKGEL